MLEPRFILRHRGINEIADLAVVLLRHHYGALGLAILPGLGFLWLMLWALSRIDAYYLEAILISAAPALILALVPIICAPASALLGGALLDPKPSVSAAYRRMRTVFPRLLKLAVFRLWPLPVMLLLPVGWYPFTLLVWYLILLSELIRFPWMVEIIVLEGQDWSSSRGRARAFARHPSSQAGGGEYAALSAALLAMLIVTLAGNHLYSLLMDNHLWSSWLATSFNPVVHWLPWIGLIPGIMLGLVVRYLAYIAMRSDSEGWEIDMRLRLAGAALEGRST